MSKAIDLRREDEVALGQSVDLVRPDRHRDLAPGEVDVRVVSLFLREDANFVGKRESGLEIGKLEGALQMMLINELPSRELGTEALELFALQRRHASFARHADLRCKVARFAGGSAHRWLLSEFG